MMGTQISWAYKDVIDIQRHDGHTKMYWTCNDMTGTQRCDGHTKMCSYKDGHVIKDIDR